MVIIDDVLDFLFPRRCHLCHAPLSERREFICAECFQRQLRTNYHRRENNPMEQRLLSGPKIERATALFFYKPGVGIAQLIYDFKYRGFSGLARKMGWLMGRELFTTGFFSDVSVILPVPLHWYKLMKRGYSQTLQLARGVSDATGIPYAQDLRAKRHHKTQTRLSHEQRRANISGIFHLAHPEKYRGKHILLVDDVCTTGATLTAAAEAIAKEAPGCRITVLTLAVTI